MGIQANGVSLGQGRFHLPELDTRWEVARSVGDLTGNGARILRFRISDPKWEEITGAEERRRLFADTFFWVGLAPDDSPVLVRDTSVSGIYALDWEAP